VLGAAVVSPALADTESDLEAAKRELAGLQDELDAATRRWQEAQTALIRTREEASATRRAIEDLEAEVAAIQAQLEARAASAYMTGTGGALELLFDASSIAELSDRLEFLDSVTRDDADLAELAQVKAEELRRERERLQELAEEQEEQEAELQAQARTIESRVNAMSRRIAELTETLRRERRAARLASELLGQPSAPTGTGGIQVCPVAGPNSFVDSFGWPRSGGRTHQGIDLMAAYGTPVVATHPGTAVRSDNALGGISVGVTGPGGVWTYYAHLSSTGTLGSVSAGTVIGYVGSTGNAGSTNHLHFELHQGGTVVNPYPLLVSVC
jgi:murein DD-endopeptidase MepM/ murein hydrolase activator NlpD